jgi:hypothetical protein
LFGLCRHRGLDPRSLELWVSPSCSEDGGAMPAMTLKSDTLTNTKLIMWHENVFKTTFAFIPEKVVPLQRFLPMA